MSHENDRGRSARSLQRNAQLCRQVYRTLVTALGCIDDDVLLELSIEGVQPYPDATGLLVVVRPAPTLHVPVESIYRALERHRGRLRAEVAAAITRKRAPELVFRVALPLEGT